LDGFLSTLSGRKSHDYDFFNTLNWTPGGLSISIMTDTAKFLTDITQALLPTTDKATKDMVISRLPQETSRMADIFVGGYKILWDSIETLTDEKKNMDMRFYRQVRAYFDSKYTPEKQQAAERSLLEKFQKVLMGGGEPPDPTIIEQSQKDILGGENILGTTQLDGSIYTMKQLGSKIETSLKKVPESLINANAGFSELTLFYKECSDAWQEYDLLPSSPSTLRDEWRKNHPYEEAMMLFWGRLSGKETLKTTVKDVATFNAINRTLDSWRDQYQLSDQMMSQLATWK
jgi:hypothetical protein